MKILLIRHARMAGDPFACPAPPVSGCLSEDVGVPQAAALARALRPTQIDVAFSSPYGRCVQTAEAVLAGRNVSVRILDLLREWQPNTELKKVPGTVFEEVCARDRERYAEETWKTELGEGCYEMYARIIPPFLHALSEIGIHERMGGYVPEETARHLTLAVFGHGGSLAVVLSHLLGVPPFPVSSFAFEDTGMATLMFTERRGIYHPALALPPPHAA